MTDEEGTLATLLGASPGASTVASTMLQVLEAGFKQQIASQAWRTKLRQMIPSWGLTLNDHPQLAAELMHATSQTLQLDTPLPLNQRPQTPKADLQITQPRGSVVADIAL